METRAFLYKWIQLSTGKWYIGSRTARYCNPDDGYICSSKYVFPLINENAQDWYRIILKFGSPSYIRKLEKRFLQFVDAKNEPMSFNRSNVGSTVLSCAKKIRIYKDEINMFIYQSELSSYEVIGWTKGMSLTTKQKMKENHKDVSGQNNPMFGVSRKGIDSPLYGRKISEDKKNRKPKSEEHKKKLAESKTGKNHPFFGKKRPKEFGEQISKKLTGRIPWNKGKSGYNTNSSGKTWEELYGIEKAAERRLQLANRNRNSNKIFQ